VEAWRDNFIQDAPESVARSIWEQLSPEPHQVNLDKPGLEAVLLAGDSQELHLLPA
jgi:hypothetical protein